MDWTSQTRWALLFTVLFASTAFAQESASESKPAESRVITGRVVSDSGQPLAGAGVFAAITSGPPAQRTSTDDEGYFKLQGLDPGLYRVSANLPGYVIQAPQNDPSSPNLFYRPGESVSLTLTKGGVIAGIVTNIEGQPVVNVFVRAYRVRDADGNKVRSAAFAQPRMSDDRGYYRIYGLPAGTYVVAAGGQGQTFGAINPYANDAPTYAPASTRDTAAEVIVHSDQETTADIRYRGEPGHAVSGRITGALPPASTGSGTGVRLSDVESQAIIANAAAIGDDRTFQLNGVSDGEYEISAVAASGPNADMLASSPRRIAVRGADLTGLELVLAPMGSIAGRVNLELDEKLNCGRRRDSAMRETMIIVRRDPLADRSATQKPGDKSAEQFDSIMFPVSTTSVPNARGEINLRNLFPATYRFEIRLAGAGWYVRQIAAGSLNQSVPANKAPATNLATSGIKIKAGDKIDVTIAITEGGAGLRGRVATGEGQNLPPALKVYLAPAERENADNVLRFFEGSTAGDGTFAIGNIAPGRYWIIAQPGEAADSNTMKSIKSDSLLRAKVLREAEAEKKEISFKPCERTVDYELPFGPAASKQ